MSKYREFWIYNQGRHQKLAQEITTELGGILIEYGGEHPTNVVKTVDKDAFEALQKENVLLRELLIECEKSLENMSNKIVDYAMRMPELTRRPDSLLITDHELETAIEVRIEPLLKKLRQMTEYLK